MNDWNWFDKWYKSVILLIIMLVMLFFIVSCCPKIVTSDVKYDSIRVEHVQKYDTIMMPADSSMVEALLKCDENGKVLVSSLESLNSKNTNLEFKLDSLGKLKMKTITVPYPVEVVRDSFIYVNKAAEEKIVTVEVEKSLSFFQQFQIRGFWILFVIVFAAILYWYVKKQIKSFIV